MSLRCLLVVLRQKQRTVLTVYQSLYKYGLRPVSLSAFQCHNKEESPSLVEEAEIPSENESILHKRRDPKEHYDYYRKLVSTIKQFDKTTVPELKTAEHENRSDLLPEAIKSDSCTTFQIKDPSHKTEYAEAQPDAFQSNDAETTHRKLSLSIDSSREPANFKDTREISRPFFESDKISTIIRDSEVMSPSEAEEATIELNRSRYTDMATSSNLTVYVSESETLKQLISLGVDLSRIEKFNEAANLILKLDFESDVKPYLLFLKDVGVPSDQLAVIITKNPFIFKANIEDLEAIIEYFKSKNFPKTDIPQILIRAPRLLSMSVPNIDEKLGFYQKLFKLTGSQVREVVCHLPKLVSYNAKSIKEIHFQMKEFLGFTNFDLQKIFLITPRVFLSNKYNLTNVFVYVHNEMGLTHAQLIKWPKIFRTRLHRIKERHEFLKHMKRDQYDATKENYVSLKALVSQDDKTFCFDIAKSSTAEFNQFLKTL